MNIYEKEALRVIATAGIKHFHKAPKKTVEGAFWYERNGRNLQLPYPVNSARRLATLLHEVGHSCLRHYGSNGRLVSLYLGEFQAEQFSLDMLRRLGLEVSFHHELSCRNYVGGCIQKELKLPAFYTKRQLKAARENSTYIDPRIARWALFPGAVLRGTPSRYYDSSMRKVHRAADKFLKAMGTADLDN